MPTKAKTADSNFTTADWATVDATSLLDVATDTNPLATTTSWVGPTTGATTGAITIDGIFVKITSRVQSPTGTFGVRLYNVTGAAVVAGTTVTINVSDLPYNAYAGTVQWEFFKFSAPVTLAGATAYRVEVISSVAAEVTLWRASAGAGNWCRALRTTTLSAPAAGDTLWICSEWTAAATNTARTATMDSTATTDYGDGLETGYPQLFIGDKATLTWGTTAATDYRLRLSGLVFIAQGGTMNMGTTGTPCPRDSSMELQLDQVTTNGVYYVAVCGTLNMQGQSRTSGKSAWTTTLTANVLAAATTWPVADDTGWLNNDRVLVSGTNRSGIEGEILTLNGAAGASSLTSTAGAAVTHAGTGNVIARLHLLTRNVRIAIGGTTTKYPGGVVGLGTGTVDADWAAIRGCGSGSSTGNAGVKDGATVVMNYCVLGDLGAITAVSNYPFIVQANFVGTVTLTDCLLGGQHPGSAGYGFHVTDLTAATRTAPAITLTRVHVAEAATGSNGTTDMIRLATPCGTYVDLYGSGGVSSNGITVNGDTLARVCPPFSLDGAVFHSSGGNGIYVGTTFRPMLFRDFTIRRMGGAATIAGGAGLEVDGVTFQGCTSPQVTFSGSARCTLRNGSIKGETSFTAAYGISQTGAGQLVLDNMELGGTGANEAHTTADVTLTGSVSNPVFPWAIFNNTILRAATPITGYTSFVSHDVSVAYHRAGGVSGSSYREYPWKGYVRYETTTFRTAAPSERLQLGGSQATLAVSSNPLRSTPRQLAVRSGYKIAVSVYVRKDGTYDGAQPRLVCAANSAIGYDSTTVVDTMSGGVDAWEELTATLPSAVAEEDGVITCWIEVDGTTGNVYVDDWSASEV